ncbi:H-NS family nucleoid-associated regulatory protein [Haliea sp.]|uniref:H-NS family nucleoid-associated regulatory protein n=1 Tax=Haliea sp. TaxID=1932666 RepID=UPI0032EC9DC7
MDYNRDRRHSAKAKTKAQTKTPKAASKAPAKGKPAAAKKVGKRPTIPPRYRLEIDGQEHLWSGRGRTPKVFQAYFDAGNSRESCEISG